jgi:hypothetical protein
MLAAECRFTAALQGPSDSVHCFAGPGPKVLFFRQLQQGTEVIP